MKATTPVIDSSYLKEIKERNVGKRLKVSPFKGIKQTKEYRDYAELFECITWRNEIFLLTQKEIKKFNELVQ